MYSDRSPDLSPNEKALYEPVSGSDTDAERCDAQQYLLSPGTLTFEQPRPQRASRWNSYAITIFNIALFVATLALFVTLPFRHPHTLNSDLKRVSAYSPVLESSEIPLVDRKVAGELFPADDGTDLLGRAEPGPATDGRWEDFEYQRKFVITGEQVRRMDKDPAKVVKLPPESGLGDDAYVGALDVFHQIHCLNVLRREAFKDYYFDGERYHEEMYGDSSTHRRVHSKLFWVHMRHCTDMLLQALTCDADTDMLTTTWIEGEDYPFPDFNINKKCKSFDAIVRWRDKHALPLAKLAALEKPYNQRKQPDAYWQLYGNATTKADNMHHPVW